MATTLGPSGNINNSSGLTGNVNYLGNNNANTILGHTSVASNDTLSGFDGNDTLNGGLGADLLKGGLGSDFYEIDLVASGSGVTLLVKTNDSVIEVLNGGVDTVVLKGSAVLTKPSTVTLAANVEILDATQTGSTLLNLNGNGLSNSVLGNSANNLIKGLVGDDSLFGFDGDDALDGGTGIDSLVGGLGNDTYIVDIINSGTVSNVILNLQDIITEINGTSDGIDTLKLRGTLASTNTTLISLSDNLAAVENLDVSLTATTKLNLVGNDANNVLIGNATNNIISGGLGNDTLTGGKGNDVFVIDAVGASNIDVITDFVSGQDNIKLSAAVFDIVFDPGFTAERLLIVSGSNVTAQNPANYLVYNKTTGELWFSRDADGSYDIDGNGIDPIELIAKFAPNTLLQWTDILNITLNGTLGNDVLKGGRGDDFIKEQLIGDFNSGNDKVYGGDGNDIIQLGSGNDYIEGGAGNDIIYAGVEVSNYSPSWSIYSDNDTVYGGDGNDSIYGGINGKDVLDGGNGDDLVSGGSNFKNASKLIGGAGNDTLYSGAGNDTLSGGSGNDLLYGNNDEGKDFLDGGIGNDTLVGALGDTLFGGAGDDTLSATEQATMNGGAGDDTYFINNTAQVIDASGIDTIITYSSYTLGSTIENLTIRGGSNVVGNGNSLNNIIISEASGNATLSGGAGNDKLTGGLGNDILIGGNGNDLLFGSRGQDTLTGGLGADRFEYLSADDSYTQPNFADTIVDFSRIQLDKIDLSAIDADTTTTGINDAFTFVGNDVEFSDVAGQVRFDVATNSVCADIDGNGTTDLQIVLTGVTIMLASDFIL